MQFSNNHYNIQTCKKQQMCKNGKGVKNVMKKRNQKQKLKEGSCTERISRFIVHEGRKIEKLFLVLTMVSVFFVLGVGTNYDMSKYLPSDAPSKQGIDLMEREFDYPGSAKLMLEDVSLYEAKQYKDKIAAVEGVDSVSWADDAGQIYVGADFVEAQDLEDYYKDRCALMSISFEYGDSDVETYAALEEIKEIAGDKGYLSGPAVDNESMGAVLNSEMPRIMCYAVIVILLILTLTTTSWLEPFLFMFVMAVGIILNMGSNIIFGEISFMTFSIGAILQLAVSMDYSIFLLHKFMDEREKGLAEREAMVNALQKAIPSIFSSAMTTFVGFLSLALMKFGIGKDMGYVLAKSILMSFFTVVALMPSIILRMNKWIAKTRHRSFIPRLDRVAKVLFKTRFVVVAVIAVAIIPAVVAQGMNSFKYGTAAVSGGEGSKTYEDAKRIESVFGESNAVIVIIPNTSTVTEKRLADELDDLPYTKSVVSLAYMLPAGVSEDFLPKGLTSQLHSSRYARIIVDTACETESDYAFQCVEEIRTIVEKYYPEDTYIVGETPVTQDMKDSITADYNKVNMVSLIGVALVIMGSFMSPIMTLVAILPIEIGININMAVPYLEGNTLAFLGYLMVSSMQLGATVDYSILLTGNYMELREQGITKKEAAVGTIEKSMVSIMTSGVILTAIGYGLNYMMSIAAIRDLGKLLGRGAVFSMVMVLCLLPFLLTVFDGWIMKDRERFHRMFAKKTEQILAIEEKKENEQITE